MLTQKTLTINIPEPCHASWDAMQPSGCGRFCAHCEKVVIDFSQMSDGEIARIFAARKDNPPCGRFSEMQLNRPLIMPEEKKPFHLSQFMAKVAAAFLLIPAFWQHSYAQSKQITSTEQSPVSANREPVVLKGMTIDALSGEPLVAMAISIDKLDYVAYSDADGNFSFALPDSLRDEQITIKADYQSTSSPATEGTTIESQTILVTDNLANTTLYLVRSLIDKADSTVVTTGYKHYLGGAYTGPIPAEHFETLKSKPNNNNNNETFWRRVRRLFQRRN